MEGQTGVLLSYICGETECDWKWNTLYLGWHYYCANVEKKVRNEIGYNPGTDNIESGGYTRYRAQSFACIAKKTCGPKCVKNSSGTYVCADTGVDPIYGEVEFMLNGHGC